jgi:RNA polymerase sigma-70 factor (ECF subfamily)
MYSRQNGLTRFAGSLFLIIIFTLWTIMGVYSNRTDIELAHLLKAGDHTAYTELYERYFPLLFIHAYKRLRDEEQAKDLIQEFFTILWDKRTSFTLTSSLSGYFFTSVNNRVIDHFLHEEVQSRYINAFSGFLETENVKTDHLVREKQLALLIENEIQTLPTKMREIFELSRKGNLSHKEIADKLNISEKTVDRQISNALIRLKNKLGPFHVLLLLLSL